VGSLSSNAKFVGCLFEDDAGKAEDKRTGLTCVNRQAALAAQCRARCAKFAELTTNRFCKFDGWTDQQWQNAFGDIGGQVVGSAHVEACGPKLKTAVRVSSAGIKQKNNFPKLGP